MPSPFDVQNIAVGLCDRPRGEALAALDSLLTWTDEPGSESNVAHMEFNVRLVAAVRIECERRRQAVIWT